MMLLPAARPGAGRVSFDQLILHNVRRHPDALALVDAPDRPLWTEGGPRKMTWSQVDAASAAAAARLMELGMGADAPVAIQGPNSADTLIAILACQRANLVPAVMPAGWRNAEAAAAIERIGAKAILAATRAGSHRPADALRQVAADNFGVRFVCCYGAEVPDGVISFEDCMADPKQASAYRSPRLGNPAEHVAIVTFDCGPGGYFPVARSHNELLAAGLLVVARLGLERESVLLSSLAPTGFAGLATGLAPWLMSGATLALQQGFDATVLGVQLQRHGVTHAVLPQIVITAASRERILDGPSLAGFASIVRRVDEAASPLPDRPTAEFGVFGEIGLVPLARTAGAYLLPLGRVGAMAGIEAVPDAMETGITKDGTLALRGTMVPRAHFPGNDRGVAFPLELDGWVATGFPARIEDGALAVAGPRHGVVSIGGHTLPLAGVESLYVNMPGVTSVGVVAQADAVLGQHVSLAAVSTASDAVSDSVLALHAQAKGVSPLATQGRANGNYEKLSRRFAIVA